MSDKTHQREKNILIRPESLFRSVLMFILLSFFSLSSWSQNNTKTGGLCFRVDNNPSIAELNQYYAVFNRYQKKFCLGITSWTLPINATYVNALRYYISQGHEVLDNTPTHQTQFFSLVNIQDTSLYDNDWGVDHINGQQICLKYSSVDTLQPHNEGLLNITGNTVISFANGEFGDLNGSISYFALYFGFNQKICLWYDLKNINPFDPDTLKIKSFWGEPLDFGNRPGIGYHKLTQRDVYLNPYAIRLLGKESLRIYSTVNLPRPETWVHPAGPMPWVNGYELKGYLGDSLGYVAGSTPVNPGYFCYNEYNPAGVKQFSIPVGDISIENYSFQWNKSRIANYFAKHYVKVDISYFTGGPGGWDAYLLRLDSLVKWSYLNNIPILTYRQWSHLLYDSIPNRLVNIFPGLNTDLDLNGFPDGYDQNSSLLGIYKKNDGVPESGNRCFQIQGAGNITQVTTLAGIEPGNNKFALWVKRTELETSNVEIDFSFPETGASRHLVFQVDSLFWIKKVLTINVPESVSLVNILIKNSGQNNDTVKVSGMDLRSTGFLTIRSYPEQLKPANEPFQSVNLNALVDDSIYDPSTINWTIHGIHSLNLSVLTGNILHIQKPVSFWTGLDSAWLVAQSQEGLQDSCYMKFSSYPIPEACSGNPITLTLLDTLSNDIIQWSSIPYDSSISNRTIYNPVVSPKQPTMYHVVCINPLGNINRDSIQVIRHPKPVPSLRNDTIICQGDSITLTVTGGAHYLWSTGDTAASIMVAPPDTTEYFVLVTSANGCTATDSVTIFVSEIPDVTLTGLSPVYCANDPVATLSGDPPGGLFGATSGLIDNQFFPSLADTGISKVWYVYTNPAGCSDSDTVYVLVNPNPSPSLPADTGLCIGDSIQLTATGGISYLWNTGDTVASIYVKPTVATTYSVLVTSENGCTLKDSAEVIVSLKSNAKLYGLNYPSYCTNDYGATLYGLPPGGIIGATSGLVNNIFTPSLADTGVNKVWYTFTNAYGCSNTDTVTVLVIANPVIKALPDTMLCGGRRIVLHAGPGYDNYQWTNGSTDSVTTVDSIGHGLGLYKITVYVTEQGCASKSTAKINFIVCPGMMDKDAADLFSLYPNPASNRLTIVNNGTEGSVWTMKVFNMTGLLMDSHEFNGPLHTVDVSMYSEGLYLLKLSSGERTASYKLIKK